MISIIIFYFFITGFARHLSSHLSNDLFLLICLPLLAVNVQLVF
jgi:hypothetical protein